MYMIIIIIIIKTWRYCEWKTIHNQGDYNIFPDGSECQS